MDPKSVMDTIKMDTGIIYSPVAVTFLRYNKANIDKADDRELLRFLQSPIGGFEKFMIPYLKENHPVKLFNFLRYLEINNQEKYNKIFENYPILYGVKIEIERQKHYDLERATQQRYNDLTRTFLNHSTTTETRAQIINDVLSKNDEGFIRYLINNLVDPSLIDLLQYIFNKSGQDLYQRILNYITDKDLQGRIDRHIRIEYQFSQFLAPLSATARNRHTRNWRVVRNEAMRSSIPIDQLIAKGRNIRLEGSNRNSAMENTRSELSEYLSRITTIRELRVLWQEKIDLYLRNSEESRKLRNFLINPNISKDDKDKIRKEIRILDTNQNILSIFFGLIRAKNEEFKTALTPAAAAPTPAVKARTPATVGPPRTVDPPRTVGPPSTKNPSVLSMVKGFFFKPTAAPTPAAALTPAAGQTVGTGAAAVRALRAAQQTLGVEEATGAAAAPPPKRGVAGIRNLKTQKLTNAAAGAAAGTHGTATVEPSGGIQANLAQQAESARQNAILAQGRVNLAQQQAEVNSRVAGVNRVSDAMARFKLQPDNPGFESELNALMAASAKGSQGPPKTGGRKSRKHRSRKHR